MEKIKIQIKKKGYFIKNSFICIPEEYYEYNLRKIKSLSNLEVISDKEIDIINKELKNRHLENINLYTNIFLDNIISNFNKTTRKDITEWVDNIYLEYKKNIDNLHLLLKIADDEYQILILINDVFSKKEVENKNIIKLLEELKIKIENLDKSNSEPLKIFLKWMEFEIIKLLNIKVVLQGKQNIKDKLKDKYKIKKTLDVINNKYIKEYINVIILKKKDKIDKLNYLNKEYNDFEILIESQYNLFFKNYENKINDYIKNNWNNILKTNKININFNKIFILGDDKHGKMQISCESPLNIEYSHLQK